MSSRWIQTISLSVLMTISSLAVAQQPTTLTTPQPTTILPFGPGERLEYKLSALGANAGNLKIGVVDQGEYEKKLLMSLAAKLEPSGLMKILWQGESRRTSFLDTATLQPLRVIDIEESSTKTWKTQLDFDGLGSVTSTRVGAKPDGSDVVSKRQVPANVVETLSGLYQLRLHKFFIGEQFKIEILDNGRIYQLELRVDRKEKIKTILGEEEAFVIKLEARRAVSKPLNKTNKPKPSKPKTIGSVASLSAELPGITAEGQPTSAPAATPIPADANATIWFAASGDQIPLRFEVELYKVGSMTAELSKYTPSE
jgi:hypothetical protein